MTYNSFFANILLRLLLLLLTITGIAWIFVIHDRFFTLLFLIFFTILQVILLFSYLNRTNRNLARFLLLLTQEDTSVVLWRDQVEKTFQGLHHSFESVNREISRIRFEKEKGTILLQRTIDHMTTGVLAVGINDRIELINEAALKLFGVQKLDKLNDLNRQQEGMAEELGQLKYDSGNVIELKTDDSGIIPILVMVSVFELDGARVRLYSLQSIKSELEAREIESWQQMTRVLAHEISNSVTPISTLGAGIKRKLSQATIQDNGEMRITPNAAADLLQSSDLITKRGNALVEFVEHYKQFTRLPEPVMVQIELKQLFENVIAYFSDEAEKTGVSFSIESDDGHLTFYGDINLLEQALINLVRNALAALSGLPDGVVTLRGKKRTESEMIMEISDNGAGISEEIRSQVFIPFFTTRQKGTGIGLSIVRKIIHMHGGNIHFQTQEGSGTTFIIRLNTQPPVDPGSV